MHENAQNPNRLGIHKKAKLVGMTALLMAGLFVAGCGSTQRSEATSVSTHPAGYTEIVQVPVNTFSKYHNASGTEIPLAAGTIITVECIIYDKNSPVTSTHGLWYRMANGQYAPTDTEWNQPDLSAPDEENAYDPNVPLCSDSPNSPLPPVHDPGGAPTPTVFAPSYTKPSLAAA